MSASPCAVVGVGQTHHKSRRLDVSFGGLVREAVFRALDDAHMTMADIEAVIVGKAPDLFEGVMKPELYLSDALGAVGKPMFRVHTAGSVGGTTAIVAASHVQVGKHRTVLAVAFEKQSEGNAQFALGSGRGASLGAGGAFAPFIRAYIERSGAPEHIGWKVAVKDRLNALEEPLRPPQDRGHLHREGQGLADDVGAHPVPRVVPLLRRRLRRGAHRRGRRPGRRGRRAPAGVGPGRIVPLRAAELPGPRPGAARRRPAVRGRRLRRRPASPTRATRSTWPSCTCRSPGTNPSGSRPSASPTRGRAGSWSTTAPPNSAAPSRSTPRAACCRATPSAPPGCFASPKRPTRCGGPPASTRWRGPRSPWAWPTAPTTSTSAPGSSGASLQPFG